MNLILDRFSYASTEVEGIFRVGNHSLATIEPPWVPWDVPGGKPYESCIPDGEYKLEPWVRPNGSKVYILSNPELGVYELKSDRPKGQGRFLNLIHIANWVTDIQGCIGPGTTRSLMKNPKTNKVERAVSSSGVAMGIIADILGREETHTLTIRSLCGTM